MHIPAGLKTRGTKIRCLCLGGTGQSPSKQQITDHRPGQFWKTQNVVLREVYDISIRSHQRRRAPQAPRRSQASHVADGAPTVEFVFAASELALMALSTTVPLRSAGALPLWTCTCRVLCMPAISTAQECRAFLERQLDACPTSFCAALDRAA